MGTKSKENSNNSTGQRIANLRLEKRLTQDELASRINIHRTTMSKIECDKRGLTFEELNTFSEFFDVSPNYLRCKTDSRKSNSVYIEESSSLEEIRLKLKEEFIEDLAKNIKNNLLNEFNPSKKKTIATRVYNILLSKE